MAFRNFMSAGQNAIHELKFMAGAYLNVCHSAQTEARAFQRANNRGADRNDATASAPGRSDGLHRRLWDLESFSQRQGAVNIHVTRSTTAPRHV